MESRGQVEVSSAWLQVHLGADVEEVSRPRTSVEGAVRYLTGFLLGWVAAVLWHQYEEPHPEETGNGFRDPRPSFMH